MFPSREDIVGAVSEALFRHPFVFACWLEGADAQEWVDAYSDIDMWLDVQDGHEGDVLKGVKWTLGSLAPLEFEYEAEHPHLQIRQAFFRLQGTPEFLVLDLNIQSHSRDLAFTRENKGEAIKVLFNKADAIKFKPLDKAQFEEELQERIERLERECSLFQVWVKKELARNRFLEALRNYHSHVLQPLVEVLRIKYEPTKRDFYLKDISQDLPSDVVATLTALYAVNTTTDIAAKLPRASRLMAETVAELKRVKG